MFQKKVGLFNFVSFKVQYENFPNFKSCVAYYYISLFVEYVDQFQFLYQITSLVVRFFGGWFDHILTILKIKH